MAGDTFESIWGVQETDSTGLGLLVNDSGFGVRAGEVLLGLDAFGVRHLLVPLALGESCPASQRGQAIQVSRMKINGVEFLSLACSDASLHATFSQFAHEVVESIKDAGSPASAAYQVFLKWKAMFLDAGNLGQMSESAIVGLVGELLTLEGLLKAGALGSLGFWTGPDGSEHDFRTPSFAVEAKASLSRDGRRVRISSVDQLDVDKEVVLWLHYHKLSRDPAGNNLMDFVERILDSGAEHRALDRKLSKLGLKSADLGGYEHRRFKQVESRLYNVDHSFPRIVRSSFQVGALPAGVSHLEYEIELTNEPPFRVDANVEADVFSRIAEDS